MEYAQWALAEDAGTYPGTASDDVEIALKVCMVDILVSIAYLTLRTGDLHTFAMAVCASLTVIGHDRRVIRGLCWWTFQGWSHVLSIYFLHCEPPTRAPGFTVRNFLVEMRKTPKDDNKGLGELLLYDMKVIKERANLDKVSPLTLF